MLEPHYAITECAEYLECSEDWLRARLRDHTFAGVKVAGRWRMRESQLEFPAARHTHEAR